VFWATLCKTHVVQNDETDIQVILKPRGRSFCGEIGAQFTKYLTVKIIIIIIRLS